VDIAATGATVCWLVPAAAPTRAISLQQTPQALRTLQQPLAQRDSLLDLRQQGRNHLHALKQMPNVIASVPTRMQQLIETLSTPLEALEAALEAALACEAGWATSAQR
jgi:hypothetical protein